MEPITTSKINQTIENLDKRLRKSELRNMYQIEYSHIKSSYVIKTTSKNIYPISINSIIQGLKLHISEILINEQGFLNLELKEIF